MKNGLIKPRLFILIMSIGFVLSIASCSPSPPSQVWGSQLGSLADDFAYAVTLDKDDNTYIAGSTGGELDEQKSVGYRDITIIKYDTNGKRLWIKQTGTSSWDESYSIAVDLKGDVYVAGYTFGSFDGQKNKGQYDLFLTKYDKDGTKLYSEQVGTEKNDYAYSLAVDKSGNVYVAGYTEGSFEGFTNTGGIDIFIVKFDTNGERLWIKQLGTPSDDIAYSIAVDKDANVYVAGYTGGGLDGNPYKGSWDAFLYKFDTNGERLWIKQLGTPSWDEAWAVSVDTEGNPYITGYTGGGLNEGKSPQGSGFDLFIAKYDTNGKRLWIKQMGTQENDYAHAITVDKEGNAYITGYTEGSLKGFTNAGRSDIFVVKYSKDGKKLWNYQTGTSSDDYTFGIAVNSETNLYIIGETSGSLSGNNKGAYDLFLMKLTQPQKQGILSGIIKFYKKTLKKIGIG